MVQSIQLTMGGMPLSLSSPKKGAPQERELALGEEQRDALKFSLRGSKNVMELFEFSRRKGLEGFFVHSKKKPSTPEQRYQSTLESANELARNEAGLSLLEGKVGDLEAFGAKTGKSKAEIEKEKKTIYSSAYETRLKTLMERAGRGEAGVTFSKDLFQMERYGRKAGKTPLEIGDDKKKIFKVLFDWTYGEAYHMANRNLDGPDFRNRLTDLDRYGVLAGLLSSGIAPLKQALFKNLYDAAIKDLKSNLLSKGCDNPDKEIIFGGSFLKVQGLNHNEILAYGTAAGLTTVDMAKDIDTLKSDLKAENERRIKKELRDGIHKIIGAPVRATKRIVKIPFKAGQEMGKGVHQIVDGFEKFVKGCV